MENMEILETTNAGCICCLQIHPVQRVRLRAKMHYKGILVDYDAEYYYCNRRDELFLDEKQLHSNLAAMKEAYRRETGKEAETPVRNGQRTPRAQKIKQCFSKSH